MMQGSSPRPRVVHSDPELLCRRLSRNVNGSDKDLLREFRDMVSVTSR